MNRQGTIHMQKTTIRRKQIARRKLIFLLASTLMIVFVIGILCGTIFTKAKDSSIDEDITYKYYTSIQVESGDSLWQIADRYISDEYDSIQDYISELIEINELNSCHINEGQYITVPYYSSEFM